jgi:RNA-directed DNA polymerase
VIATAFEPGSSIVSNAKMHRNSRYSVRVDLSDFFPSIRLQDLIEVIKSNRIAIPDWALEPQVQRLFAGACFDRNMRLPVGYPTSPRIANLVMKKIDEQLISTIKSDVSKYGNAVLSRYADDFVFSTDMRGACANFVSALKFSLATTPSPVLRVNEKKTKMMSREGGSTLITGLRVKQNGQVGIHANYRDHLRLLLKLFAADLLKTEERQQLRGHLAFIANADPSLYTKLSFKYFAEIAKLNELTAMPSPRASPPFKSAPSRSSRN